MASPSADAKFPLVVVSPQMAASSLAVVLPLLTAGFPLPVAGWSLWALAPPLVTGSPPSSRVTLSGGVDPGGRAALGPSVVSGGGVALVGEVALLGGGAGPLDSSVAPTTRVVPPPRSGIPTGSGVAL